MKRLSARVLALVLVAGLAAIAVTCRKRDFRSRLVELDYDHTVSDRQIDAALAALRRIVGGGGSEVISTNFDGELEYRFPLRDYYSLRVVWDGQSESWVPQTLMRTDGMIVTLSDYPPITGFDCLDRTQERLIADGYMRR
jgi:hypothetical protein